MIIKFYKKGSVMKFIKIVYFLLVPCIVVPIFSSEVIERAKAREELNQKLKETSSMQEEIRKKEQEIEEKKKIGDVAEEKRARKELIELDEKMNELLDAKIKFANEVLNFAPNDEVGIKAKKDAEITKKFIEAQIKEVSKSLASEGTAIEKDVASLNTTLSLGDRLVKNFKVWRDTTLAKVHESLGSYEKAKQLRDNLVILYKELKKPLKVEENVLASDRLTLKLGEIPKKLTNNIDFLMTYLESLNTIELNKNKKIKLNPKERKTIEAEAQNARNTLLNPEKVSEIFETTLKLRDMLADDKSLGIIAKEKLETLEKVLANILMVLDASAEKFKPRTKSERNADAKKQESVVNTMLAPGEIKKNLNEPLVRLARENQITTIKADPFKAQASKEYKTLENYLTTLESIDRTLLSPEKQLELAVVVKNAYEQLSNQYGSFLTDLADFNKRFTQGQRDALLTTLVEVNRKKEIWTSILQDVVQSEKALANENSPEYQKKYTLVESKNNKAKVLDEAKLNAAEIVIGNYKERIEKLLEIITTQKDAPAKIDTEAKNLDQKVEEIVLEIAKADPSQRSVKTLRRIISSSSDLINEISSIFDTTDLSYEAQTALLKVYLKSIIRNDQLLSQLSRDQGSLTTVIENRLVTLPQVERAQVDQLHTIPAPPPPPTLVQAISNAESAVNANIDTEKINSLAKEISKVALTKTERSEKKLNPENELVADLANSLTARRAAMTQGEEYGNDDSDDTDWND